MDIPRKNICCTVPGSPVASCTYNPGASFFNTCCRDTTGDSDSRSTSNGTKSGRTSMETAALSPCSDAVLSAGAATEVVSLSSDSCKNQLAPEADCVTADNAMQTIVIF